MNLDQSAHVPTYRMPSSPDLSDPRTPVGFYDNKYSVSNVLRLNTVALLSACTRDSLRMLFWFVIVSLAIHLSVGQDELLTNPNFENDFDGNWRCTSCLLERSTDAYEGQYSAKISER